MSDKSNDNVVVEWVSHPFLDFPKSSVILVLFFIFMGYGLWQLTVINWDQPFYYFFGMLILFGGTISYFIPTHYAFRENEIVVHYWIFKLVRPYSNFGCYYTDKKGVMLSTFTMPRRLDPFRGLNVRFSKTQKEKKVLFELLERKIGNKQ
jgi:hypothetical protein